MATSTATESSPSEVPHWLQSLPVAPEYHPTLDEFQDPISYIFRIEQEASQYGICKIIPPLPPASKTTIISNFNRSVAARNPSGDSKFPPTFTTLQQHTGETTRKSKGAWQSGETYTFKEFEVKAKNFEKTHMKRSGKRSLSELEAEGQYWKAVVDDDKSLSVECASDLVGSAFAIINGTKLRAVGEPTTVGETPWNMRGVSRAKGSLLRFIKEDIPGMTSPMMYLAMLFSWFSWHVKDHGLHSLDYIHIGAGKTWYGVPKEASTAFEEVFRGQGYGGEVNHLVGCATLAEKTTIMPPEVLISAGIPCCRLVQNAGEFVVTFPRAYCCIVSHGFNCSETTNIATPEWLEVAKEAAGRGAYTNHGSLVSHLQLLYAFALSFSSSIPLSISNEPRSSRLKEKERGEGETMVKELFVQNVIQNNELLHVLLERESSCVLLPQKSYSSISSNQHVGSNIRNAAHISSTSEIPDTSIENENATRIVDLLERGFFPCVTCGILSFPCAAVIRPSEEAARYFVSSDCSISNDSEAPDDEYTDANWSESTSELYSGQGEKNDHDDEYDIRSQSNDCQLHERNEKFKGSDFKAQKGNSALNLLAAAYGNPSDSEDEDIEHGMAVSVDENRSTCHEKNRFDNTVPPSPKPGHCDEKAKSIFHSSSSVGDGNEAPVRTFCSTTSYSYHGRETANVKNRRKKKSKNSQQNELVNLSPKDSTIPNHIFCLEHAVEVEKQLRSVGGANVLLVCYREYPRVEKEAKALAGELGINHKWKDILFRKANNDDHARIKSALNPVEVVTRNQDWTSKLGISLYPVKPKISGKTVAGKWCGRVWMSNQVHPSLAKTESDETETTTVTRKSQRKRMRSIRRCDSNVKQKEETSIRPEKRVRRKPSKLLEEVDGKPTIKRQSKKKTINTITEEEAEYECDIEECTMSFSSKKELLMHKRNICVVEGCGKKFFSHKYLVQHKRVHTDDRPLMCPWKGCKMTFKWSWARTEHIRVHTGVRPYECQEPGCGQTFRFVTDFSRHRRKTGHSVKKEGD